MQTALSLLGYDISWLELIGTLTGLASVWLAVRNHVWTWPVGLINVVCFAVLFYQFRLYSDALLQVYFFAMSLYGWWHWRGGGATKAPIVTLSGTQRVSWLTVIFASTLVLGLGASHLHTIAPTLFPEPAAYPFPDAFTTVASIAATYLLARRTLESWALWVAVDVVSIVLYFSKGIMLVGLEYIIFLILATAGGYRWYRTMATESTREP